jgi:hypothetical protein
LQDETLAGLAPTFEEKVRNQKEFMSKIERGNDLYNMYNSITTIWNLWHPIANCKITDRIGNQDDGGKVICNIGKIKKPCVVYSFGTAFETTFEGMFNLNYSLQFTSY